MAGDESKLGAKQVLTYLKDILFCIVFAYIFVTFIAQNAIVSGDSMLPTLKDGDVMLVNKVIYRIAEPQKGDVIAFNFNDNGVNKRFIKRVIGQPGDTIDIRDGSVYVNDEELKEPYVHVVTMEGTAYAYPYTVEEDSFFVLGDNRNRSRDSRDSSVGTVSGEQIIGKAKLRLWPITRIGFIR